MPEKTVEELTAEVADLQTKLTAATADVVTWKGHAKTWEDRSKENFEKAQKFDKGELDKLPAVEAAEKRAKDAEEKAAALEAKEAEREQKDNAAKLRAEVAKDKKFDERKLSDSVLRGTTKEELEAHADEILALLPPLPNTTDSDGQGKAGLVIGDGELSVDDIVKAATGN